MKKCLTSMASKAVRGLRMFPAVLAVFCLHPLRGATQSVDTAQVLRVGDVVHIRVWRNPELSGEFTITEMGTIAHPLYNEIRAAGRAIPQVREDLRAVLSHYLEKPSFVVEVLFPIMVGGEVRVPNIYKLTSETTVARAVSLAGGATPSGRPNHVILRRDGQNHVINLTSPNDSLRNYEIRSGDEIVVTRRKNIFRDYIAPGSSVVAALATVYRLINP